MFEGRHKILSWVLSDLADENTQTEQSLQSNGTALSRPMITDIRAYLLMGCDHYRGISSYPRSLIIHTHTHTHTHTHRERERERERERAQSLTSICITWHPDMTLPRQVGVDQWQRFLVAQPNPLLFYTSHDDGSHPTATTASVVVYLVESKVLITHENGPHCLE